MKITRKQLKRLIKESLVGEISPKALDIVNSLIATDLWQNRVDTEDWDEVESDLQRIRDVAESLVKKGWDHRSIKTYIMYMAEFDPSVPEDEGIRMMNLISKKYKR